MKLSIDKLVKLALSIALAVSVIVTANLSFAQDTEDKDIDDVSETEFTETIEENTDDTIEEDVLDTTTETNAISDTKLETSLAEEGTDDISTERSLKETTAATNYSSNKNTETVRIYDIFPDEALARQISLELNVDVNDIIPVSELESISILGLAGNTSPIKSLEGIQYLTGLKSLDIYKNEVEDISPLRELTNLESLTLELNKTTDFTPIEDLTNLTHLGLIGEEIDDISFLESHTNLEGLVLCHNKIKDISCLTNLTNLSWLNLRDNSIEDISTLTNLTNLQYLYLDYNNIEDISALTNLIALEEVFLNDNAINDISVLKHLSNLELNLVLGNNDIEDISVFGEMTNQRIYYADLSGNRIKDLSVFEDIQWPLENLDLANNEIEDISNLSTLIEKGHLLWLDVSGNKITDISPAAPILENQGILFAENQEITLPPITIEDNMREFSFDSRIIGINNTHMVIEDSSISPQAYYENGTIVMLAMATTDFDVTYSFEEIYGGDTFHVPIEWPIYGELSGLTYYRDFSFTGKVTQPYVYEDIWSMPDDDSPAELISTDGIIVTGTFPEGTELITKLITSGEAYTLLASELKEDNTNYFVYDITLEKNGEIIQPDSEIQVSIPIPDEYGVTSKIYRLEENNSITLLDTSTSNGYITFSIEHFSYYGIGDGLPPESSQGNGNNTGNSNNGNIRNNSANENVSGNSTGNTTVTASNIKGSTQTNDTASTTSGKTTSAPATSDANTLIPYLLCFLTTFAVIGALYQRKRHRIIVQ